MGALSAIVSVRARNETKRKMGIRENVQGWSVRIRGESEREKEDARNVCVQAGSELQVDRAEGDDEEYVILLYIKKKYAKHELYPVHIRHENLENSKDTRDINFTFS